MLSNVPWGFLFMGLDPPSTCQELPSPSISPSFCRKPSLPALSGPSSLPPQVLTEETVLCGVQRAWHLVSKVPCSVQWVLLCLSLPTHKCKQLFPKGLL